MLQRRNKNKKLRYSLVLVMNLTTEMILADTTCDDYTSALPLVAAAISCRRRQ